MCNLLPDIIDTRALVSIASILVQPVFCAKTVYRCAHAVGQRSTRVACSLQICNIVTGLLPDLCFDSHSLSAEQRLSKLAFVSSVSLLHAVCRGEGRGDSGAAEEEPRGSNPGGAGAPKPEGGGVAQGEAGNEAPLLQGLPAELPQVPGPPQLLLQADRQEAAGPQGHDPGQPLHLPLLLPLLLFSSLSSMPVMHAPSLLHLLRSC